MLLDLKHGGLSIAPKIAVADGVLGFWKAIRSALPGSCL
jgi:putative transposase